MFLYVNFFFFTHSKCKSIDLCTVVSSAYLTVIVYLKNSSYLCARKVNLLTWQPRSEKAEWTVTKLYQMESGKKAKNSDSKLLWQKIWAQSISGKQLQNTFYTVFLYFHELLKKFFFSLTSVKFFQINSFLFGRFKG